MKRSSLWAAVAIVLVANLFALVHVWKNRSAIAKSDITLTQRELPISYAYNDENSGVELNLQWLRSNMWAGWEPEDAWLDPKHLTELGFDTSVSPSDARASEFYRRQRTRKVFVALEFDGPAWREYVGSLDREAHEPSQPFHSTQNLTGAEPRLVPIDADLDSSRLRARRPNRNSVIIVPALIAIQLNTSRLSRPAALSGFIREIPSSIHVPKPFSEAFEVWKKNPKDVIYKVHLRYGAALEPWIVGVDFPASR